MTTLLPSVAVLEMTYRCNHACRFCSCPWFAGMLKPGPEMEVDEWKRLIEMYASAGFPPIVVPSEARLDYIRELWDYQRAVGVVSLANRELLPEPSRLDNLRRLVKDWWQTTLDLVAEAKGSAK